LGQFLKADQLPLIERIQVIGSLLDDGHADRSSSHAAGRTSSSARVDDGRVRASTH